MIHSNCLGGVLTSKGFLYCRGTLYLSVYAVNSWGELGVTAAVPYQPPHHTTLRHSVSIGLPLKVYCDQVPKHS